MVSFFVVLCGFFLYKRIYKLLIKILNKTKVLPLFKNISSIHILWVALMVSRLMASRAHKLWSYIQSIGSHYPIYKNILIIICTLFESFLMEIVLDFYYYLNIICLDFLGSFINNYNDFIHSIIFTLYTMSSAIIIIFKILYNNDCSSIIITDLVQVDLLVSSTLVYSTMVFSIFLSKTSLNKWGNNTINKK